MTSAEISREFFRAMLIENIDLVREALGDMAPVQKDALSVPEVAARTGLSEPTIRRRIKSGTIPTVPGLNPARIPANFINRMMKNES